MKTTKLVFIVLAGLLLMANCKKEEEKSISEQISGTYECRIGNTLATTIISKKTDNTVDISISTIAKNQTTFNGVIVTKSNSKSNTYILSHSEIVEGSVTYLENGKSYAVSIQFNDEKITGYKDVNGKTIAAEIVGIYNGEMGDLLVNADVSEVSSETVNIKLSSTQPNFTTINLEDITVEKFVFDTLGNPSLHYELKNNLDINNAFISVYESDNTYKLIIYLNDSRYYRGILEK